jgi:hypothetical protein
MTAAAEMRAAAEALRAGHPPIPPVLAEAIADWIDAEAEWLDGFGGVSPFEIGGPQPAEYRHYCDNAVHLCVCLCYIDDHGCNAVAQADGPDAGELIAVIDDAEHWVCRACLSWPGGPILPEEIREALHAIANGPEVA